MPVEFKLHGITTIEQANSFLSEFMVKYNRKFSVSPEDNTSAFRALDESINLDHILCIKEKRMIIEDSVFSYGGKYYQLLKNGKKASALPKAKITVLISNKIGVKAMYSDGIYDTRELTERPKKAVNHQHKEKYCDCYFSSFRVHCANPFSLAFLESIIGRIPLLRKITQIKFLLFFLCLNTFFAFS